MPTPISRSDPNPLYATIAVACALYFVSAAAPVDAQSPAPTAATTAAPAPAAATTAAPAPAEVPAPPLELGSLAWLDGCWRGDVAKYQLREHWLPQGGGIMVGAGHTLLEGKTSDYQYLRLENRADGVYYVSIGSDRKEVSFRLSAATVEDKDTIFTFTSAGSEFPARILYRRAKDGWLYATVEGKLNGEEKTVIYPMRHVDCQSGGFILK